MRCDVPPADRSRLVAAIDQLPAAMGGRCHNLDIKAIKQSRQRRFYRLRVGDFDGYSYPPAGAGVAQSVREFQTRC
jgi:hypothetical protein